MLMKCEGREAEELSLERMKTTRSSGKASKWSCLLGEYLNGLLIFQRRWCYYAFKVRKKPMRNNYTERKWEWAASVFLCLFCVYWTTKRKKEREALLYYEEDRKTSQGYNGNGPTYHKHFVSFLSSFIHLFVTMDCAT